MAHMVRKQIYITTEQKQALKELAEKEGTIEANILRESFAAYLTERDKRAEQRRKGLEELREMFRRDREERPDDPNGKPWVFNRDEL